MPNGLYAQCRKLALTAECRSAECRCAECRSAECLCAECRGDYTTPMPYENFQQIVEDQTRENEEIEIKGEKGRKKENGIENNRWKEGRKTEGRVRGRGKDKKRVEEIQRVSE